jgi:hypothetical protein
MQTVSPAGLMHVNSAVRVGDRVDCTLYDHSHVKFKVTAIESDALVGSEQRVPIADIASLTLKRFDAVKTTELTIVIVLGLGASAYAAADAIHHIPIAIGAP